MPGPREGGGGLAFGQHRKALEFQRGIFFPPGCDLNDTMQTDAYKPRRGYSVWYPASLPLGGRVVGGVNKQKKIPGLVSARMEGVHMPPDPCSGDGALGVGVGGQINKYSGSRLEGAHMPPHPSSGDGVLGGGVGGAHIPPRGGGGR